MTETTKPVPVGVPRDVDAIRWQTRSGETLDWRLSSDSGWTRTHALEIGRSWNGARWGALSGIVLMCGRKTPPDDVWIGVETFDHTVGVDCGNCLRAMSRKG